MALVVELASVVLAAGAVVLAWLAFRASKRTERLQLAGDVVGDARHAQAEERHRNRVRPLPEGHASGHGGPGLRLRVNNVGGAASRWISFYAFDGHFWQMTLGVPANHQYMTDHSPTKLASLTTPAGDPSKLRCLASVAKDVDEQWWDCLTGKPIPRWRQHVTDVLGAQGIHVDLGNDESD